MKCKYPIVLVHGVAMKELRILKAFGKIGQKLKEAGNAVFVATTDGFGTVESNAHQLKAFIERVLCETGAEQVNVIAHSKGGLDTKYMITDLGMESKVASLTTLCTPHKGSVIASGIWQLPRPIKRFCAFWIDAFYKIVLRDEHPDSMKTCEQLRSVDESEETLRFSYDVYCQSYSTSIENVRDCYIMAIPMKLHKHYELIENDGLVSERSARFENYKGRCLDIPVSHIQIIDFMAKKSQKEQIYAFYRKVCDELAEMGF